MTQAAQLRAAERRVRDALGKLRDGSWARQDVADELESAMLHLYVLSQQGAQDLAKQHQALLLALPFLLSVAFLAGLSVP